MEHNIQYAKLRSPGTFHVQQCGNSQEMTGFCNPRSHTWTHIKIDLQFLPGDLGCLFKTNSSTLLSQWFSDNGLDITIGFANIFNVQDISYVYVFSFHKTYLLKVLSPLAHYLQAQFAQTPSKSFGTGTTGRISSDVHSPSGTLKQVKHNQVYWIRQLQLQSYSFIVEFILSIHSMINFCSLLLR